MSSLLQIRGIPDETRRTLKARAAARGQSLNAYMLELIGREVGRPTVEEVLDRAARRSERARESAAETIQAGRADREQQLGATADG